MLVDKRSRRWRSAAWCINTQGELAVINYDPEDKSYRMTALKVPGVRRVLSRAAEFYKKGKKGPRTVNEIVP